jgi:hypothetical protein
MIMLQIISSLRYGNIIIITLLIMLYGISFKKILKSLLWIYSLKLVPEYLKTFSSSFVREECIYIRIINKISLHKSWLIYYLKKFNINKAKKNLIKPIKSNLIVPLSLIYSLIYLYMAWSTRLHKTLYLN